MLHIEDPYIRTYDERMEEVLKLIPLISSEWTNVTPSDPGITVIENLSAFSALQGATIGAMPYEARLRLLAMTGFRPKKGKCARVLLSSDSLEEPIEVKSGERFFLGNLCFETNRRETLGKHHILGVYSKWGDEFQDVSFLTNREFNVPCRIFGDRPRQGMEIYIIADSLPEAGKEMLFYMDVEESGDRNPLEDRTENYFSSMRWECYTVRGFKPMRSRDYTGAFLMSGELKLKMPDAKANRFLNAPKEGYCIRGVLEKADYDIKPRLFSITGFLFEVWQKNTRSVCQTFQKSSGIEIVSPFRDAEYMMVFGKEEKGSSYRRYELSASGQGKGRLCHFVRNAPGFFSLSFSKEDFGYEPERLKDAIKVVLYSEEIMRRYNVGRVMGYDNQELELPLKSIVPDSFCLIAKRLDQNGEELYDFVRPEKKDDECLYYHLLETDGKIVIEDPGDFTGAELFIGSIAVTEGDRGNIRAGNRLEAPNLPGHPYLYNPGAGTGGSFKEKLDSVISRFRADMRTPFTCVTAEDYEHAVRTAPGLCIKKVKAVMDETENLVRIAIMPGTEEKHPVLSDIYRSVLRARLEQRRLVTTRYILVSPVYVPVNVKGTIYVKHRYGNCAPQIVECFRNAIDYLNSDRNFGDVLRFEDVFQAVEGLSCVEFIYDMSMRPAGSKYVALKDSDIYPAYNCLLYLGDADIETVAVG